METIYVIVDGDNNLILASSDEFGTDYDGIGTRVTAYTSVSVVDCDWDPSTLTFVPKEISE